MSTNPFATHVRPDSQAFLACLRREGTPRRVHHIEIYLDEEVKQILAPRFGLLDCIDKFDSWFVQKREIALQRFLGYDYVVGKLEGVDLSLNWMNIEDTAQVKRESGRLFIDEHRGPITSCEEYERYPWPDLSKANTGVLEWYEKNLPDDMCVIGGLTGHFAEELSWLMGYETLCLALYDQRDLVRAIAHRLFDMYREILRIYLQFSRVRIVWGTDDMGFRSGTLISPKDLREFVLPGHKMLAAMCHEQGRLYLLHSCGRLTQIYPDIIEDIQADAKHSFEDTIEDVRDVKREWGDKIALLGGLDMDFMCRASSAEVRARTRDTLKKCQPGGGYCLGTGNSVANYLSIDNYLAMLDEGRRFT